jgi:membrane-bound serine protease (ClpP class)
MPVVVEVRLENEAITPVTVRVVRRALATAAERQAECLLIVLDTPGGLIESTRTLVKEILGSPVPVVVYVAPPGARAASAGLFVTLAAHVAAMAPGTSIGAAHPVPLGGLPSGVPRPPGDREPADRDADGTTATAMMEKSVNDTVAWAEALAELRGRDATWVAAAVRSSESLAAGAAVEAGAVDLLADDTADLLARIDGREVEIVSGRRRLVTAAARIERQEIWWGERVLAALADPNLAILLLVLGFYGVLFELSSPGWGVPGTLGTICLCLSLFSLAILPVRAAGLVLVVAALALFVAEVFVTAAGGLALAGAVCLVLGGLMLVESPAGFMGVSLTLLLPIALAAAVVALVLLGSVVRAHRRRVLTGGEAQLGARAVAVDDFLPAAEGYFGSVRMHGELWRAASPAPVGRDVTVEVLGRDGLVLAVQPRPAGHAAVSTAVADP